MGRHILYLGGVAHKEMKMQRFFYLKEIRQPTDVIEHLAKGKRDWRKGYSAYELAHSWVNADGIPRSVRTVPDTAPRFANAELIEGFFEREIDLRTAGHPSQTDLMALIRSPGGYSVVAVEGKVEEPFGQLVHGWNDQSTGKTRRLEALCKTLGLDLAEVGVLRYQLLHRTASAIYEAQRYTCDTTLMLVHSFSQRQTPFENFQSFARAMGMPITRPGLISASKTCEGVQVYLGWVADQPV